MWTESEEMFSKSILSFKVPGAENILEQHFLFHEYSDGTLPVFIPKEEIDFTSSEKILSLVNRKKSSLVGLNTFATIKSTVMCFGDYVESGTVTSKVCEKRTH